MKGEIFMENTIDNENYICIISQLATRANFIHKNIFIFSKKTARISEVLL